MKYSVIFLDLDNTVLDFKAAEKKAISALLKESSVLATDELVETYSKINDDYWKRFEAGIIKKEEIFAGRFKTFVERTKIDADPYKMSERYFNLLSFGNDVIDGAEEMLEEIKKSGATVCVTTNGVAKTQYKRIKSSGLEKFFDYIFVSEDAGSQKPEKAYFDYVIKNIPEVPKNKILVVGDSESSDIAGGINSGLDTCWYNPHNLKPALEPTYIIDSLDKLPDIIRGE